MNAAEESLFQWLENFRQTDAELEAAYELIAPKFRAAIKTGIAMTEFHFRPRRAKTGESQASPILGFQESSSCQPVELAIIVLDADYAAMARLCAAACLPALAGVQRTLAIIAGQKQPSAEILLTLELCGIEDIYCLNPEQLLNLPEKLPQNSAVSILHDGKMANLAGKLRKAAGRLYEEAHAPDLLIISPDHFDPEILRFCQGNMPQDCLQPHEKQYACAYIAPEMPCDNINASLFLEPGCEGFWLHAGLNPELYMACRMRLGFYNGD